MTTPPSSRADDPKPYPPEPDEATWNAVLEKIAAAVLPPVVTVTPAPTRTAKWKRSLSIIAMLSTAAVLLLGIGLALRESQQLQPQSGPKSTASTEIRVSRKTSEPQVAVLATVMPIVESDDVHVWSVRSLPPETLVVGDSPMPEKLVFAGPEEVRVVSGKEYLSLEEPNDRPMIVPFPR